MSIVGWSIGERVKSNVSFKQSRKEEKTHRTYLKTSEFKRSSKAFLLRTLTLRKHSGEATAHTFNDDGEESSFFDSRSLVYPLAAFRLASWRFAAIATPLCFRSVRVRNRKALEDLLNSEVFKYVR